MRRSESWMVAALINSVAIQASTYLARPMISYKLLGLHAGSFMVGSFGALYALFPLILAIPLGRWINQFGEGRFIAFGTVVIVASTCALASTDNKALMVLLVAFLGTAQLLCMAGKETAGLPTVSALLPLLLLTLSLMPHLFPCPWPSLHLPAACSLLPCRSWF